MIPITTQNFLDLMRNDIDKGKAFFQDYSNKALLANATDEDGNTALHHACSHYRFNGLQNNLLENTVSVYARNHQGLTPLHCALLFSDHSETLSQFVLHYLEKISQTYPAPASLVNRFFVVLSESTHESLRLKELVNLIFGYFFDPVAHFINEIHQPQIPSIMEEAVLNRNFDVPWSDDPFTILKMIKEAGGVTSIDCVSTELKGSIDKVVTTHKSPTAMFRKLPLSSQQLTRIEKLKSNIDMQKLEVLRKQLNLGTPFLYSQTVDHILNGTDLIDGTDQETISIKFFSEERFENVKKLGNEVFTSFYNFGANEYCFCITEIEVRVCNKSYDSVGLVAIALWDEPKLVAQIPRDFKEISKILKPEAHINEKI